MTDTPTIDNICMCGLVNLGEGVDFVRVDRTMHAREVPCYHAPVPTAVDAYADGDEPITAVGVFGGTVEVIVSAVELVRQAIDIRVQQRARVNDEIRQLRDDLDRLERMQRIAIAERSTAQREDQA